MKTYKKLYKQLISISSLQTAYWNARRHKNTPAIEEFHKNHILNIFRLHLELKNKTYMPQPMKTFILRDPKTRTICVSDFRDRIVHHALVNVLQPIYEPRFIFDSYASRRGKGTLPAVKRLEKYLHKVTRNGVLRPDAKTKNDVMGYVLKADIRHYFDTVDHDVLIEILSKKIKDEELLWLLRILLQNYNSGRDGKGMPLGNWTSQFFANVYLNELDAFIKQVMKIKYYVRYVDDFVILHRSGRVLQEYKLKIDTFLKTLKLELHPQKCNITPLKNGIHFVGYAIFYYHKRIRKRNIRKIFSKIHLFLDMYKQNNNSYETILEILCGWKAYAMHANTYQLCNKIQKIIK
ncbi:group II intron reverse transcriptase domain-containing protein [Candidatus Woesearchaeota archaeon]|nr:group II intron reverse transcriptase domain-containing protein [Candidatus Woesearchaeota archaeon]